MAATYASFARPLVLTLVGKIATYSALAHVATVQGAHDGDVNSIRFSPGDPTVLATAGDDAFVKIWKWRGGP